MWSLKIQAQTHILLIQSQTLLFSTIPQATQMHKLSPYSPGAGTLQYTTSVAPSPTMALVNFSMDASTCFFRRQAWEYFILVSQLTSDVCSGDLPSCWLMVQCWCLKYFFSDSATLLHAQGGG